MATDKSKKQAQLEGLREAVRELESMRASGEIPSAHGIGSAGNPLSIVERLVVTKKKIAELEAES